MYYGEILSVHIPDCFICLLGLSNFNSKQVDDIISKSQIKPAVLQVECHPYLNQAQLIKHCKDRDIVGKQGCPPRKIMRSPNVS